MALGPRRPPRTQFFQYFVNVDDRDVERFLLQLTFLRPMYLHVEEVMDRHREAPERSPRPIGAGP